MVFYIASMKNPPTLCHYSIFHAHQTWFNFMAATININIKYICPIILAFIFLIPIVHDVWNLYYFKQRIPLSFASISFICTETRKFGELIRY
jgi:quinol-cytochrome oxidoreductase complex cytochrome b subunit